MNPMIDFGITMLIEMEIEIEIEIDIVIDIVIVIVIVINLMTIFVIRFQYNYYIKMEEIIKFLEDEGFEFEVGCREKERKKI